MINEEKPGLVIMKPQAAWYGCNSRFWLAAINLVGGAAVLGTYYHGVKTHDDPELLWGDIRGQMRQAYISNMPFAAFGYISFTLYLLMAPGVLSGELAAAAYRRGRGGWFLGKLLRRPYIILSLYFSFLSASSAWMPASWYALDNDAFWMLPYIQGELAITGFCAIGLTGVCLSIIDPPYPMWHWLSLVGMLCLVFQCAVLDALIWPRHFSVDSHGPYSPYVW